MPYAEGRVYFDADSHLMELHDWLLDYIEPRYRAEIGPLRLGGAGRGAEEAVATAASQPRKDEDLMTAKGWAALGAFDRAERSHALDLLGFDRQLVFSTFSPSQFLYKEDPAVRWAGIRAHNTGMVDFCSQDERLLPVALVPLDDPHRAAAETASAIAEGATAVHVTHDAPPEFSHTHPVYDGVWRALAESGTPFVLHVGGSRRGIKRTLHNNGLPPITDFLGGGENIRSKDYIALAHAPEVFISCMAMDGAFDRFPELKGGVIELGAVWVPAMLTKLDLATSNFRKSEPQLTGMELKPSEYVHRQVWFTPFPGEPVGQMIEQAGEDLFLFSSDYPHPEGTKDPLGRFEATLTETPEPAKERFYSGNFADMVGATV